MAWAVAIVVWAARRRTSLADRRSAVSIVSALAGILVISQVGMPTQNPAVALTCWTFLFWYVLVRSPGGTTIARARPQGPQMRRCADRVTEAVLVVAQPLRNPGSEAARRFPSLVQD